MDSCETKVIQLNHVSVADAFEKEAALIQQMRSGELQQCLLLWQPSEKTLVLPASKRWQAMPELVSRLAMDGWEILSRRTGGAPVPQTPGVINLSHIYYQDASYSIQQGYRDLCDTLTQFFASLGLDVGIHATPYSYCDGDYNINLQGRKIVGTAQRISAGQQGQKIILAQACLLVNADIPQLMLPVNLCNEYNQKDERVKAESHTGLHAHLEELPSIGELYQHLANAFNNVVYTHS